MALNTIFEKQVCTRCGGSGRYSFNQIDGSVCYGCHGRTEQLTKRGAAARDFLKDRLALDPSEVKVGDVIRCCGVKRLTVAAIEVRKAGEILKDGEWIALRHYYFTNKDGLQGTCQEGVKGVTRFPTAEDHAAALAYQDTLTKAGKPRKR